MTWVSFLRSVFGVHVLLHFLGPVFGVQLGGSFWGLFSGVPFWGKFLGPCLGSICVPNFGAQFCHFLIFGFLFLGPNLDQFLGPSFGLFLFLVGTDFRDPFLGPENGPISGAQKRTQNYHFWDQKWVHNGAISVTPKFAQN